MFIYNYISIQVYPNDSLSLTINLSTYFSDPDGDSLTYTFVGLPSYLTASQSSSTTLEFIILV